MDELRPICLHISLLEFENALAGIFAIFKIEKKLSKADISEIVEVYFRIPKDLKIIQREHLKKLLKNFFKYQDGSLSSLQKKNILHEFQSLRRHDIWCSQEYIAACVALGEVETAREN